MARGKGCRAKVSLTSSGNYAIVKRVHSLSGKHKGGKELGGLISFEEWLETQEYEKFV